MSHLDSLGVAVNWVSAPWFLSVFVNVLPWESVLRVWDVLLFEDDRTMLFRTALALIDMNGEVFSRAWGSGVWQSSDMLVRILFDSLIRMAWPLTSVS